MSDANKKKDTDLSMDEVIQMAMSKKVPIPDIVIHTREKAFQQIMESSKEIVAEEHIKRMVEG